MAAIVASASDYLTFHQREKVTVRQDSWAQGRKWAVTHNMNGPLYLLCGGQERRGEDTRRGEAEASGKQWAREETEGRGQKGKCAPLVSTHSSRRYWGVPFPLLGSDGAWLLWIQRNSQRADKTRLTVFSLPRPLTTCTWPKKQQSRSRTKLKNCSGEVWGRRRRTGTSCRTERTSQQAPTMETKKTKTKHERASIKGKITMTR